MQEGQGNVLHVDVVSISSDIRSNSREAREARRDSRRLFWDTLSRRSARSDDALHVSSSTESSVDLGTRRRWLYDFSDDSDNSESSSRNETRSLNRRHRQHSRSEVIFCDVSQDVIYNYITNLVIMQNLLFLSFVFYCI